jgi:predicted phosphoribosyltransferase
MFRDRREAGRTLATRLTFLAGRRDLLVLALPRGGVPVAFEVARALRAPLDVFVVRKLGVPGQEELAMGAIATGRVRVLNEEVIGSLNLPPEVIDRAAALEQRELARREELYRGHRPPPEIEGRTILLIDDGIATGSTMLAAIRALRAQDAAAIVVGTPTIAPSAIPAIRQEADDIVAVLAPEEFRGVGMWYEDFTQTSDAEVNTLLEQAAPILSP